MEYKNLNVNEVLGKLNSSRNGLEEKEAEKRLKNMDLMS